MCRSNVAAGCTRRSVLVCTAGAVLTLPLAGHGQAVATGDGGRRRFIAEAEAMRRQAVRSGDQSYGAIVTRGDEIVGWGPSRVVLDRNPDAHAERVAIWDAQTRLGTKDLRGCALYSTSRACGACEAAAAGASVERMYWGPDGRDAGPPRG
jgi:tRNA(Arg) A34 adenosine deaminase TadA